AIIPQCTGLKENPDTNLFQDGNLSIIPERQAALLASGKGSRYTFAQLEEVSPCYRLNPPISIFNARGNLRRSRRRATRPTHINSNGPATPADLVGKYASADGPSLENSKPQVRVAGRILTLRLHGKAGFAHISGAGQRLQIYVKLDIVGSKAFELFRLMDL